MQIKEIKKQAKSAFAFNRYSALLHSGLVYGLALNIAIITTVLAVINFWTIWYGIVLILLFLLALMPYKFGMAGFYLRVFKYEKQDGLHLFDGMNRKNLERVLAMYLIKFGIWLGLTLLLIVPGVIFAIRTSMATYLLRANPKLSAKGALKSSNKIMKSHSFDYFKLSISFIGWALLSIATFGIATVWLSPYFNAAKVVFYKRELQGDTTDYRTAAKNAAIMNAANAQAAASLGAAPQAEEIPFLTQSYDAVDSIPYELTAFDESGAVGVKREEPEPILDESEPIAYTAEYMYQPADSEPTVSAAEPIVSVAEPHGNSDNRYVSLRERGLDSERRHDSLRNTDNARNVDSLRNTDSLRNADSVRNNERARNAESIINSATDRNVATDRRTTPRSTEGAPRRSETERGTATGRSAENARRPSSRETDNNQRRITVQPLPGASVRMDENGRRSANTVKPPESRQSTGESGGESVREHLERLRADRMASRSDSRADGAESSKRNTNSGDTDK